LLLEIEEDVLETFLVVLGELLHSILEKSFGTVEFFLLNFESDELNHEVFFKCLLPKFSKSSLVNFSSLKE
jgi:hypothetical protein